MANTNRKPKGWRYTGPKAGLSWLGIGTDAEVTPEIDSEVGGSGDILGEMGEEEEMSPTALQELAHTQATPSGVSSVTPPTVNPVKWYHPLNILSKGAMRQNSDRLQANITQAGYEAALREQLQQQAAAARGSLAGTAHQNSLAEIKARIDAEAAARQKELELMEGMKRRELMQQDSNVQAQTKLKGAVDSGLGSWEDYQEFKVPASRAGLTQELARTTALNEIAGTGPYNKSVQSRFFAENAKPGVDNELSAANALKARTLTLDPGQVAAPIPEGGLGLMSVAPFDKESENLSERAPSVFGINPMDGTRLRAVPKTPPPQPGVPPAPASSAVVPPSVGMPAPSASTTNEVVTPPVVQELINLFKNQRRNVLRPSPAPAY